MPRFVWTLAAVAVALGAAGCGDDDGGDRPRLVVSAASSLGEALTACSAGFEGADVRLSLAGSDELAAQIRQGVRPDVFASADSALPEALAAEGLAREPVAFAVNALVLAVPAGSGIDEIADLARGDVSIAIGSPTVPIGAYTAEVLRRLPPAQADAIRARVRTEEPDVKGIVGKLSQGAVDAGFVYRTDVRAAGDDLAAVALPRALQPEVVYGAAVVEGAEQPALAERYVAALVDGPCGDALRERGFGPPPAA
ncbi:MAG TPA: molybdate ABC transporter substrate-binding protein [Capillimicrobium sp.]|jgi:molybdate transport system substrate-binding protein